MSLEHLLNASRIADAAGELGKAEHLCRQVLETEPQSVDALLILGSIAARTGRNELAIEKLREVASLSTDSYDAERWLAGLVLGQNGGTEAIEHAQSAVRIQPEQAEAHALLGLAYLAARNYELAIPSFKTAIALEPCMAGAHHNLGIALQREQRYEEAIDSFRHALALAPRMIASHLHLGQAYLSRGEAGEAISCFRTALEFDPNLRSAKALLADATFMGIRGDHADDFIRKGIEANPSASFPHALMGSWLQEQGRFEEAEGSIRRSLELQPIQGFGYYLMSNNRKLREADRPLVEQMEAVASVPGLHDSDRRYVHFALGKAYDDLNEYENAIRSLDLANGEIEGVSPEDVSVAVVRYTERVRTYMQLLSKTFLDSNSGKGLVSSKPIFVFGMPRSGTTLIEQIISRHSKVGAGGEQLFWRDRRRRVQGDAGEGVDFAELAMAGHDYLDVLSAISPESDHVTDKFPSNYVHLGLLQLVFPNGIFIHSKRNPIDTCLSIYMRPFFTINEFGYSRQNIVEAYKLYLELMQHWHESLPPGRILDVEYEKLVTDPETVSRRMVAHCGLEWEDACLHPEAGEGRVRTFSKWQVRQPVYTTSVERWRNYEPWLGAFRELMPADQSASAQ